MITLFNLDFSFLIKDSGNRVHKRPVSKKNWLRDVLFIGTYLFNLLLENKSLNPLGIVLGTNHNITSHNILLTTFFFCSTFSIGIYPNMIFFFFLFHPDLVLTYLCDHNLDIN